MSLIYPLPPPSSSHPYSPHFSSSSSSRRSSFRHSPAFDEVNTPLLAASRAMIQTPQFYTTPTAQRDKQSEEESDYDEETQEEQHHQHYTHHTPTHPLHAAQNIHHHHRALSDQTAFAPHSLPRASEFAVRSNTQQSYYPHDNASSTRSPFRTDANANANANAPFPLHTSAELDRQPHPPQIAHLDHYSNSNKQQQQRRKMMTLMMMEEQENDQIEEKQQPPFTYTQSPGAGSTASTDSPTTSTPSSTAFFSPPSTGDANHTGGYPRSSIPDTPPEPNGSCFNDLLGSCPPLSGCLHSTRSLLHWPLQHEHMTIILLCVLIVVTTTIELLMRKTLASNLYHYRWLLYECTACITCLYTGMLCLYHRHAIQCSLDGHGFPYKTLLKVCALESMYALGLWLSIAILPAAATVIVPQLLLPLTLFIRWLKGQQAYHLSLLIGALCIITAAVLIIVSTFDSSSSSSSTDTHNNSNGNNSNSSSSNTPTHNQLVYNIGLLLIAVLCASVSYCMKQTQLSKEIINVHFMNLVISTGQVVLGLLVASVAIHLQYSGATPQNTIDRWGVVPPFLPVAGSSSSLAKAVSSLSSTAAAAVSSLSSSMLSTATPLSSSSSVLHSSSLGLSSLASSSVPTLSSLLAPGTSNNAVAAAAGPTSTPEVIAPITRPLPPVVSATTTLPSILPMALVADPPAVVAHPATSVFTNIRHGIYCLMGWTSDHTTDYCQGIGLNTVATTHTPSPTVSTGTASTSTTHATPIWMAALLFIIAAVCLSQYVLHKLQQPSHSACSCTATGRQLSAYSLTTALFVTLIATLPFSPWMQYLPLDQQALLNYDVLVLLAMLFLLCGVCICYMDAEAQRPMLQMNIWERFLHIQQQPPQQQQEVHEDERNRHGHIYN